MATRNKVAKAKSKVKATAARAKSSAKKSAKTVVKLKVKKPAAKANGLPRPSSKAWGQAGRALEGIKILDFTHVQSGPTCTQSLGHSLNRGSPITS